MSDLIRELNAAGIEQFRTHLSDLRSGFSSEPPWHLLEDPAYTRALPVEIGIERKRFASRWGFGKYLVETLAPLPLEHVVRSRGLWSWLALYHLEMLCPPNSEGRRRPGRDYRHVAELGYRYRYRHLAYGPYLVYRRHGGHAILLLSGPPHTESRIYQEITSRQDLIANRGVVEATHLLYMDRARGLPMRGAQSAGQPGNLRRFVRVLQQLDLTYDIYGMSGQELVELLPQEFERWRHNAAAPRALAVT